MKINLRIIDKKGQHYFILIYSLELNNFIILLIFIIIKVSIIPIKLKYHILL